MSVERIVAKILLENAETRNSSKLLIWEVYKYLGFVKEVKAFDFVNAITEEDFMSPNFPSPASIVREARRVQSKDSSLAQTVPKVYRRRKRDISKNWKFSENVSLDVWKKPSLHP